MEHPPIQKPKIHRKWNINHGKPHGFFSLENVLWCSPWLILKGAKDQDALVDDFFRRAECRNIFSGPFFQGITITNWPSRGHSHSPPSGIPNKNPAVFGHVYLISITGPSLPQISHQASLELRWQQTLRNVELRRCTSWAQLGYHSSKAQGRVFQWKNTVKRGEWWFVLTQKKWWKKVLNFRNMSTRPSLLQLFWVRCFGWFQ